MSDTDDTQPTLERAIKNVQFCQKRGGCPSCRSNLAKALKRSKKGKS